MYPRITRYEFMERVALVLPRGQVLPIPMEFPEWEGWPPEKVMAECVYVLEEWRRERDATGEADVG